jgi:hypothetical protein
VELCQESIPVCYWVWCSEKPIYNFSSFFVLGSGFYFLSPYLQLNTKPKNWENGYQQPVTPRLKNTLNGLGKGF